MIVLVEGVDGSGKTSLVDNLIHNEDEQFYYYVINRYEQNAFEQWTNIHDSAKFKKCIVLFDRSFLTDLVYRLQDTEKPDNLTLLQMSELLDKDTRIVYCKTSNSFNDSMKRGEDNIVTKEQSDNIQKLYDIIMLMIRKFTPTKVLEYDWRTDDINNVINFIKGGQNGVR